MPNENLGAAERIVNQLTTYTDHMVHNRPGIVTPDPTSPTGVKWDFATYKEEDGKKVVYKLIETGQKAVKGKGKGKKTTQRVKIGTLWADGTVRDDDRRKLAEYRNPGLFPEVAEYVYRQIAEVWKLDNEFAAKWASWAFGQTSKDLKVALAAFMLVQSRKGDPVKENGEVVFMDDDYRSVGEAMLLQFRKDKRHFDAKLILRVHDLLRLPQIATINRELGFGRSARRAFLGRWDAAVTKWLGFREDNPRVLQSLVGAGYTKTVRSLARQARYKPQTPFFTEALRWGQVQADDGHRDVAIGVEVAKAESWAGLTEEAICEKIVANKPNWKRIVGLLPKEVGVTRAIMAAAIEAGCLSNKDLVIQTPTLEELGLLQVQDVKERWEAAVKAAEDQRAANIAKNVKSQEAKDKLQEGADAAVQKAVEEVVRGLRIYVFIDVSGSMHNAIEQAKRYIETFLHSIPLEQLHVAIFNTTGREVEIKHRSAAGVNQAFRGKTAGGGTDYGNGVFSLRHRQPKADEDVLFVFVGDEEQHGSFEAQVEQSGLRPMAFGFIRLRNSGCSAVRDTAAKLGIPCFLIDEQTFDDVYAVPRIIRGLVAATPVGKAQVGAVLPVRKTIGQEILDTDLLQKPVWAV